MIKQQINRPMCPVRQNHNTGKGINRSLHEVTVIFNKKVLIIQRTHQKYTNELFAFLNIWFLISMPTNLLFLSSFPIVQSFSHFGWLCNMVIKSMDTGDGQLPVLKTAPTSCPTQNKLRNCFKL